MSRKTFLYIRVSTLDQAQGAESQARALNEWCTRNNIIDYETYTDHGVSGAPSAMAYDPKEQMLYVAVGGSPSQVDQTAHNFGYNVEKFEFDVNSGFLRRISENNVRLLLEVPTRNVFHPC